MTILKYLLIFLVFYFISNAAFWWYQEDVNYDDMQTIKSLGKTINIERVSIEEKDQSLEKLKTSLDEEKLTVDKLFADKKYAQYNKIIVEYNKSINEFNTSVKEYENLVDIHNKNVRTVNELIIKSGTRKYLFPLQSYTPELYKEIN
jgi:hypothetical protein